MAELIAKEYLSMLIDAKTLLLHKLKKGDVLLFLYVQGVDKYPTYSSFIKTGLEKEELCFYAYDTKDHKWHPEIVFKKYIDSEQLHLLPLGPRDSIPKIENKLKSLYNRVKAKHNTLRALIDFGGALHSSNEADIISCERKIIKKSKDLQFIGLTALQLGSLSYDKITELLSMHEKTAIFTPYDVGITLNFSAERKLKEIPLELVSLEHVEQFVKNNLENIVLFLLQDQSLCGYDLIKTISQRYHILLSQGTVYPLLYTLTRQGVLEVKQELKAKVYYLTEEGRKTACRRLEEFRKVHGYMLGLLGNK